jgi:hypothetical protein
MSKKNRIPEPRPAPANIVCECDERIPVTLLPGPNKVVAICPHCGSALNIDVLHDGFGLATIYRGTIEQVVP